MTVDKMEGRLSLDGETLRLLDLPGTYTLLPKSEDESVAFRVLSGLEEPVDGVLVVLDATQLDRGLLLATQVMDLGLPVGLLLTMKDVAERQNIQLKTHLLYQRLGLPVLLCDARKKEGIAGVKELLAGEALRAQEAVQLPLEQLLPTEFLAAVQSKFGLSNPYQAYLWTLFAAANPQLGREDLAWLQEKIDMYQLDPETLQQEEMRHREAQVQALLRDVVVEAAPQVQAAASRWDLDRLLLHPFGGYAVFLALMLLIFQAIFTWAEVPMDWIDAGMAELSALLAEALPAGALTDLLTEGLLPGIAGVVIFIPQIALLFGFLAFLEDSGYLSRVVFLMDRWMRPLGLHGKSVVPLISGMACAIPGVMAARSISNRKERLITMLVTPWMSCSARLPIYIILIGLILPDTSFLGVRVQALALLGMYVLGLVATLLGAWVLHRLLKTEEKSYLLTELPLYRWPRPVAVLQAMVQKSRVFVWQAGRVILSISIVLWVLASYGPTAKMEALEAEQELQLAAAEGEEQVEEIERYFASQRLENSYMGMLGQFIEPAIRPLGYDWKIGIALLTSFAAREVFVATVATIYSVGEDVEDVRTIREKMGEAVHPDTGEKVYTTATGWSLMLFYALAMQCMSTLAVMRRETKTWKWPLLQALVMTVLAYSVAACTYALLA
ncbi:ferrous iron transport protein B [Nitritalea halalkaliphila LW7]|uniref:Ferrous iron transport protein B n=1 Tax=Nitritalea halalkaliphila LW7 TaxID=1189621 RepID=I5C072_9BACT|nr:ferrous iron transport protein B [Nitritalea halalkaliphila LW7]